MPTSSVGSTVSRLCSLMLFLYKRNQGFLEKWSILHLEERKNKVSLGKLAESKSKKVFNSGWSPIRRKQLCCEKEVIAITVNI